MSTDNQETGISMRAFAAGAVVLVVAAFVAIWFMFPAPDTRHDLVSPSGAAQIELGELCDAQCNRVAILDRSGNRSGCPLPLESTQPLFVAVSAAWSADEASVDVSYVATDGSAGSVTITLADCTLAQ